MKRRNRAKLGLLALLILGGELLALLVLLLSGPVSAAFAPDNGPENNANSSGSGTTVRTHGNAGHGQENQANSKGWQSADYIILCLAQPSACEDPEDFAWPNNFDLGPWDHIGANNQPGTQYYAPGHSWSDPGGPGNPAPGGSPFNLVDQPGTNDDAGNDPDPNSTDKPGTTDDPGSQNTDPDPSLPVDLGDPGETDGGPTDEIAHIVIDFPPTLNVETPTETLDVPEPLSLSLFASGIAGVLAARHRRKSKKNTA